MSTSFELRMEEKKVRDRLAELESVVEANFQQAHAASVAMHEIIESKLYRLDYKTLDEYCKERWHFGRTKARQIALLSTSEGGVRPQNGHTKTPEVDEDPPLVRKSKKVMASYTKVLDGLSVRKPGGESRADKLRTNLRTVLGNIWKWSEEPDREPPPPNPAKCKYCGMACLWVTTENWKRMLINEEQTVAGTYDLNGGMAVLVKQDKDSGDRQPLYQPHFFSCTHKNGKPEEPLPD